MTQDFNDMNHRLESLSISPVAQSGITIGKIIRQIEWNSALCCLNVNKV